MTAQLATSVFQEAIEAVERLSSDDQEALIEVINKRLALRRREEIVEKVRQAREDYAAGNVWRGTAEELIAKLRDDE